MPKSINVLNLNRLLLLQIQLSAEFAPNQMLYIIPNIGTTGSGDVTTESDDVTAVMDDVISVSFILSMREMRSQAVILYTNSGNKVALYANNGRYCKVLL